MSLWLRLCSTLATGLKKSFPVVVDFFSWDIRRSDAVVSLLGRSWIEAGWQRLLHDSRDGTERNVLPIEHGYVTPDDPPIEFPAVTKVLDEIEGSSYTVGEDGNPTGPPLPVLLGTTLTRPMPEANSKPHTERRAWLATANLVLLVGAVLWYVSDRRRFAR